jgi:hypothetical protein
MKKPSASAAYFRERGEEAIQWALEAGDNSYFRDGFARIANAWFEAAAEAELAEETGLINAQGEQPATLH